MVRNLHNKTKGALGEIAVAKDLLAKGYQVCTELAQQKSLTLRIDAPHNNQTEGVHWFAEFSEFERALRDHTQRTLAVDAEGEEMVQTATESMDLASES